MEQRPLAGLEPACVFRFFEGKILYVDFKRFMR